MKSSAPVNQKASQQRAISNQSPTKAFMTDAGSSFSVRGQQKLQNIIANSPRQVRQLQQASYMRLGKSTAVVQCYEDVKTLYEKETYGGMLTPDKKADWLSDYSKIQEFLASPETTAPYLQKLDEDAQAAKGKNKLLRLLNEAEEGIWKNERPTFIGFVPATVFSNIVADGQAFKDAVNNPHGSLTHRLQWYLIQKHSKSKSEPWLKNSVIDLYKEAVADKWDRPSQGKMWDAVVDITSAYESNELYLGRPEALKSMLIGNNVYPALKKEVLSTDEKIAKTKQKHLKHWRKQVEKINKDNKSTTIEADSCVAIGDYVFTGFIVPSNKDVKLDKVSPTVVYKKKKLPTSLTSKVGKLQTYVKNPQPV